MVDFTSGVPVAISTSINTAEGCASLSSSTGRLLFYTDGKAVYNSAGATMPHGASIVSFSTNSAEQAALIISVIGNPNQYYIFSREAGATPGWDHMAYSIVDMTLDSGLGDIVSDSMGIPLVDTLGENMIAVTGNNNDIWLITHKLDTSIFLAYNISSAGIGAPVLSNVKTFVGSAECYQVGMLKASPNRRKLLQAEYRSCQGYGTSLYDFDPGTGIISNGILIDTFSTTYGAEFSPDNTKVYLSNGLSDITQYDISSSSISAIAASRYVVTDTIYTGDLKLGSDGKIYFSLVGNGIIMGSISSPNLSGALCGYSPNAVTLLSNADEGAGLPNLYVTTDTTNRVGISEIITISNIMIYPNPATTTLTISANQINQITINNLLGQTMYSHECNSPQVQVDVANFPPGVYFVKINSNEVRKFVKE